MRGEGVEDRIPIEEVRGFSKNGDKGIHVHVRGRHCNIGTIIIVVHGIITHTHTHTHTHSLADELKHLGNAAFKEGNYEAAIEKYTEAIALCPLSAQIKQAVYYR